jgi:hypothetical protein
MRRNYQIPKKNLQQEKRLKADLTNTTSNFPETKALGFYQALCLLVAGAGFEPATFGL